MRKGKKAGNILVYALMAMLIAGLGGFGISNFSGGGSTVATVGDRDITAEEYFRAMTQAIRAQEAAGATDLSMATLDAMGLPAQVRGQLAGEAALNNETDRIGLSVGDAEVARRVRSTSAFTGINGEFDREAYEFALDRNGWTVAEFERTVRDEAARQLLQAAVTSGISGAGGLVELVGDWLGEGRSFRWVRFSADGAEARPLPTPTEDELAAYHAANEARFTLPEMKRLTYAVLTPEMLADAVDVDEAALRALYAERADRYVTPERRLVERLVFGTAEDAAAAKDAIDAGETDFETLVRERELTLADVDLGEATREDLGQAADAVFSLEAPGVVGPYPSSLGPALFRMNGILAARETPFEEAEAELRAELGRETASDMIEGMINDLDDRLAGGATLEDLAAETDMALATIDYWDGAEGDVARDPAFREAAEAVTADDFPEIVILENGGIVAMRLDETLPPRLQELEEVREEVIAGWQAEKRLETAREAAEAARAQLDVGGRLGDGGEAVETAERVTRTSGAALPAALLDAVFDLEPGESVIVELSDAVLLVQLDDIVPRDENDAQIAQIEAAIGAEFAQGVASDLMIGFTQAMLASAGISFDDAGLNAVHTQLFR